MAGNHAEEKAIHGMIDNWYFALRRGEAAGLATAYADDVVVASLAPPLLRPEMCFSMSN
jgi:ketosteroid isomerase-like protein